MKHKWLLNFFVYVCKWSFATINYSPCFQREEDFFFWLPPRTEVLPLCSISGTHLQPPTRRRRGKMGGIFQAVTMEIRFFFLSSLVPKIVSSCLVCTFRLSGGQKTIHVIRKAVQDMQAFLKDVMFYQHFQFFITLTFSQFFTLK